jgi:DNA-binding transcriptional LysR family regulator
MELRHLRYFVAVAEELSFTRAAASIGIKQPPLSLQIRQLEKELGAPLFRRLGRTVELTGAGKLLLEEARNILAQVERTKTDVKRRARGETGQIWIGTAEATYFEPLVNVITREFGKTYPGVFLYAEENSTQMLMAKVHAGKLDAAFVWSPIAGRDDLAIVPIANKDCVVMLPAGHALDRQPSIPIAALAKEKFILFARRMNTGVYDSIIAACHRAGFQPILGPAWPHIFAAFPIVAAGFGISIVPECLTRVHVEGVSFRPLQGGGPFAPISLVHRRNDNSAAVKNLVSLVRRIVPSGAGLKKIARTASA